MALPDRQVSLFDAVRYALCSDPRTREAWAALQVQAAQLGQAEAAFWPKLDAAVQLERDHTASSVQDHPEYGSDVMSRFHGQALSLTWVLYDFGARSAAALSAQRRLLASRYGLDDALQSAFLKTAKDYEAARSAAAGLGAARETAEIAKQSLDIAQSRMEHGVSAVSDVLQAQTAYTQAMADETHAEGTWRTAVGELAIDMGLDPAASELRLPPLEAQQDGADTLGSLRSFLDDAERLNPKINAARAQHLAALAHAAAVQDAGLPSLRLTAKLNGNSQPLSAGLGLPSYASRTYGNMVGVELDVPLFEGFAQTWREREAQAQAKEQEQALADARQQVMRGVWSGFEDYKTATADVGNARSLAEVAKSSLAASQKRYRLGVANVLEVLNAQTALTRARQQQIQAQTEWLVARLQLAYAVGNLGESLEQAQQ